MKVVYVGTDGQWLGLLVEALKGLATVMATEEPGGLIPPVTIDLVVFDGDPDPGLGRDAAAVNDAFIELLGWGYKVAFFTSSPTWTWCRRAFAVGAVWYGLKTRDIADLRREFNEDVFPQAGLLSGLTVA